MKNKTFDHSNNKKRKSDFDQKLLDGNTEALLKLLKISTVLDDEDECLMLNKMSQVVELATKLFDVETIKKLDCKMIASGLYQTVLLSDHVINCYDIGEFTNEDFGIYIYPNVMTLDDGSVVRVLISEFDELDDDDLDDIESEDLSDDN